MAAAQFGALPPVEEQAWQQGALERDYIIPPLSVLDTRQGYWQLRRQRWLALGIESELGRSGQLISKAAERKGMGGDYDTEAGENAWGGSGTSVFDPVLAELAYRWWAPPGGRVLDPFAGGSVRGIVAAMMGHPYVGIDLSSAQVEANRAQAERIVPANRPTPEWLVGDSSSQLLELLAGRPVFDLVFTCPPYFDLEVYSDHPADLSAMASWGRFVEAYDAVWVDALRSLAMDRFAVAVVSEIRDGHGMYRGLVPATIAALERAGGAFYNEAVLVNSVGSLPLRVGNYMRASRKLGRTHQNVVVAVQGNPEVVKRWSLERPDPPALAVAQSLWGEEAPAPSGAPLVALEQPESDLHAALVPALEPTPSWPAGTPVLEVVAELVGMTLQPWQEQLLEELAATVEQPAIESWGTTAEPEPAAVVVLEQAEATYMAARQLVQDGALDHLVHEVPQVSATSSEAYLDPLPSPQQLHPEAPPPGRLEYGPEHELPDNVVTMPGHVLPHEVTEEELADPDEPATATALGPPATEPQSVAHDSGVAASQLQRGSVEPTWRQRAPAAQRQLTYTLSDADMAALEPVVERVAHLYHEGQVARMKYLAPGSTIEEQVRPGMAAELAVARMLRQRWNRGDREACDVGADVEVRYTAGKPELRVYEYDHLERVFVLVTSNATGAYVARGWLHGEPLKGLGDRRETEVVSWYAQLRDLRPMDELLRLYLRDLGRPPTTDEWSPADPMRPCWTCGGRPTGAFPDGSPKYGHAHPPDEQRREEVPAEVQARWRAELYGTGAPA